MTNNCHLLIVGFDEIVANKYMEVVLKCIQEGIVSGYSIIDLCGQERRIEKWIGETEAKPDACYYMPYSACKNGIKIDEQSFKRIVFQLIDKNMNLKVYIATEASSHEYYLRFFMSKGISVLSEKPVICPMKDGQFDPIRITPIMKELCTYLNIYHNRCSVMNFDRYHKLFYDKVYEPVKRLVDTEGSPITSIHIKQCGGVWNTHKEFDTRTDHPYKYGYGMLMHGGYHYIDLAAQFLKINKDLYANIPLSLSFVTYMANPMDQESRIGSSPSNLINDIRTENDLCGPGYGETDFVTILKLSNMNTHAVITLGSICLEQTTTSIRNWEIIPEGQYNKNGRVSDIELDVSVSVVHRTHLHSYDMPTNIACNVDSLKTNVRISTWNNISLLPEENAYEEKEFCNIHHSDGNKQVLYKWLHNDDNRSTFESHLLTMEMVQSIALSMKQPGKEIRMVL
ncbi:hypothetical protein [Aristaeella lactis]|uniref:Uncharacterized protein n=1 Tax=Aristaeella lactis TaxID=3046383 RepID=A0AC61PL62_9FIRM|nr:hypothetical protein [Aristaeella lactis]QUA52179.1 hypothetical protein JYE50_10680 [Aristaeella lactis]SMC58453.1 hypothetical protein SAMN06297397_1557 [Aristaeella lactis]